MTKQGASLLGFERLYEDHIRRKVRGEQRRKARDEFEAQDLSFSPVVNNEVLPARVKVPVFERLANVGDTLSRVSVTSEQREFLSSSFTPSLTSKQFFEAGADITTMHNRHNFIQRKIRKLQVKAREEELAQCSFAPAIRSLSSSTTSAASSQQKPIFEKLYELHKRTQRKFREKAEQLQTEEAKDLTFQPKVNFRSAHNSVDSLNSSASERLFADYQTRQDKLALLRAKYSSSPPRSPSLPPSPYSQPAYERLYDMQKSLKDRQAELLGKVMREEGVTFKPKLFGRGDKQ